MRSVECSVIEINKTANVRKAEGLASLLRVSLQKDTDVSVRTMDFHRHNYVYKYETVSPYLDRQPHHFHSSSYCATSNAIIFSPSINTGISSP